MTARPETVDGWLAVAALIFQEACTRGTRTANEQHAFLLFAESLNGYGGIDWTRKAHESWRHNRCDARDGGGCRRPTLSRTARLCDLHGGPLADGHARPLTLVGRRPLDTFPDERCPCGQLAATGVCADCQEAEWRDQQEARL